MFVTQLSQRMDPKHLVELVIDCEQLRFEQLIHFLHQLVNLRSLTIPTSILHLSAPRTANPPVRLCNRNIREIALLNPCTFQDIHIVMHSFQGLQSLTISVDNQDLELMVRYLFQSPIRSPAHNAASDYPYAKADSVSFPFRRVEYIPISSKSRSTSFDQLSSLCCRDVSYATVSHLKQKIGRETYHDDFSIDYFNENLHIWW